jgi:hypothetical protein
MNANTKEFLVAVESMTDAMAVAAMFKHKKLDFQSFSVHGQSEFYVALKDYDAATAVLEFLGLEA